MWFIETSWLQNVVFPQVEVAGYNQKLHVLVAKIMEKITSFDVREDRFDVTKVNILLYMENH